MFSKVMPYPASYLCFKEFYSETIQVCRALQDVALWVFQEASTRTGEKLKAVETDTVTIEIRAIASAQRDRNCLQFRGNGSLVENYTANYVEVMQRGQVTLLLVLIPLYWYFKYQNYLRYKSGVLLLSQKLGHYFSEFKIKLGKILNKYCGRSVKP